MHRNINKISTLFLLTTTSAHFSMDEITLFCVKVLFKLITLQYVNRGTIIILNISKAAS